MLKSKINLMINQMDEYTMNIINNMDKVNTGKVRNQYVN